MATVCSDNFSSEDLLTSTMWATLLKFGAVPAIIPQSSDDIPILYETEDETNKENRPDNDNSIGSSIGIVTGASLSYSLEDELDKTNSSSVTLTASRKPSHTESELDTNIDSVKDVLPPPLKKEKLEDLFLLIILEIVIHLTCLVQQRQKETGELPKIQFYSKGENYQICNKATDG